MLVVYVDSDACPVKQEVCKVANRYRLRIIFVSNAWMRLPDQDAVELVVVDNLPDAADDFIVEHIDEGDVVVTADIPLASRCIKKGARVISPSGRLFTNDNIGEALATRNLMSELWDAGGITGGAPPFQKQDRFRFLQNLDTIIQGIKRTV
jgi:hypothetical protein